MNAGYGNTDVVVLALVRGDRVLRTWAVPDGPATVGSSENCTVTVRGDDSLHPRHLQVACDDGRVVVMPEPGSSISVNHQQVDLAFVDPQDTIRAGRLTFRAWIRRGQTKPAVVARMEITTPDGRRRRAQLRVGRFVVGSEGKGLALPFEGIAPRHLVMTVEPDGTARLRAFEGQCFRYNGHRVRAARIKPDDVVEIGAVRWTWLQAPPSLTELPPPPEPPTPEPPPPPPRRPVGVVAAAMPKPPPPPPMDDERTEVLRKPLPPELIEEGPTMLAAPERTQPEIPELAAAADEPEEVAEEAVEALDDPAPPTIAEEAPAEAHAAPALPPFEPWEEEDDDEDSFEEPFDMAALLLARREERLADGRGEWMTAQVTRVVRGRVTETHRVFDTEDYRSPSGAVWVRVEDQVVVVGLAPGVTGVVHSADLDADLQPDTELLRLRADEAVRLETPGATYAIEAFHGPVVAQARVYGNRTRVLLALAATTLLHLATGLTVSQVNPTVPAEFAPPPMEVFAEVALDLPPPPAAKAAAVPATRAVERVSAPSAPSVASSAPSAAAASGPKDAAVGSLLASLSATPSAPVGRLVGGVGTASAPKGPDLGSALAGLGSVGEVRAERVSTLGGGGTAGAVADARQVGQLTGSAAPKRARGEVSRVTKQAKVSGRLSREQVSSVVSKHLQKVQSCYERALVRDNSLSGRIVFDWVVTDSGGVRDVRVRSSTLSDPAVATCIRNEVAGWAFPQPDGGEVTISYPFLFRSAAL
jgi:hypothetical protein